MFTQYVVKCNKVSHYGKECLARTDAALDY